MRYTLFGQADGVLTQSMQPLWAVTRDGIVLDISISARSQGIQVGMAEKTARALLPQLIFYPPSQYSDTVMPKVWEIIQSYTPWVEIVTHQQFYAQIPATVGASKEVRQLILALHRVLSPEQRIRMGLAECKGAARALVEWSRYGTIPRAGLYTAAQQQLIVSPAIIHPSLLATDDSACSWLGQFPIGAMWMLSTAVRQQLAALGVFTFGQFLSISDKDLKTWFGRDIWLLKQQLFRIGQMIPAVSEGIPKEYSESWAPLAGEAAALPNLSALAQSLLEKVVKQLREHGLTTQHIQLGWETDMETSSFSRVLRQPLCTAEVLWSQLLPGLKQLRGYRIHYLQLRVQELRPVQGQQLSFTVSNQFMLPVQQKTVERLNDVLSHVNQKFPEKLKRGLQAGFRELRMKALGEW